MNIGDKTDVKAICKNATICKSVPAFNHGFVFSIFSILLIGYFFHRVTAFVSLSNFSFLHMHLGS